MPLSPGTRLGDYEIVAPSHLGAGGMGEVYRSRDPRLTIYYGAGRVEADMWVVERK